jgi:NTP pyrophosphatase (non-canonical NTP hydrolase)
MIGPNTYQAESKATAIYHGGVRSIVLDSNIEYAWKLLDVIYCVLGLNGEAGEIAEKLKKQIRSGKVTITPEFREELSKEIGDVLWYIAQLCTELDLTLEDVMDQNLHKLRSRQERNVLHGEGDDR